jgi:hypothetical protein
MPFHWESLPLIAAVLNPDLKIRGEELVSEGDQNVIRS